MNKTFKSKIDETIKEVGDDYNYLTNNFSNYKKEITND